MAFETAEALEVACALFRARQHEGQIISDNELDDEISMLSTLAQRMADIASMMAREGNRLSSGRAVMIIKGSYSVRAHHTFRADEIAELMAEAAYGGVSGYGVILSTLAEIFQGHSALITEKSK